MPRKASKRAAQGSGTIRQRKDGRWEARFTVGRDPGTGKQVQKSIYGASEGDVAKKLRAITASIDDHTYSQPTKMLVRNWADIWIADYCGRLKERTFDHYEMHVRLNIKPFLGAIPLAALGAHSIQSMYNTLQRGTKDGRKLSAKSIRNLHGVVHSMLDQAVKLGYRPTNPANGCTLPRVEKKEMQFIKDAKLDEFLSVTKGHQFENVYLVDVFTGMRQGEILGLTWADVDFENGIIHVRKQLQKERKKGGIYKRVNLKNDRVRRIKPAPFVMDVLKVEQRKQKEWKLRAGSVWCNDMGLVFTNGLGRHLVAVTVYNNFKKIVKSIGMNEIRMHDLRHTFAMLSLQMGVDIKTLQQEMGHHDAGFTLQIYGHVSDAMLDAGSECMQRFINEWKTRQ